MLAGLLALASVTVGSVPALGQHAWGCRMRFANVDAFSVPVAAGWPDLGQTDLPPGVGREARLLHGGGITANYYALRLIESDSGVAGAFLAFWPTAGIHVVVGGRAECQAEINADDRELAAIVARDDQSRWGCRELLELVGFEACQAQFIRQPPWRQILQRLDSLRIWTVPDVSDLPEPTHVRLDGVGFEIELRDRTTFRRVDPGFAYFLGDSAIQRAEAANTVLLEFVEHQHSTAPQ